MHLFYRKQKQLTEELPKGTVWPPPLTGQEEVPDTQQTFSWSISELLVGILAGATVYIVSYLALTFLMIKLGINIANHHTSWIITYRLLGGLTQALPLLNLLWPGLIFLRTKKRSISFATGNIFGGIVVMLVVIKIMVDLVKDFPRL